jgi:hypothetical protein
MIRTTATVLLLLALSSPALAGEISAPYRGDRAARSYGHVSTTSDSRDRSPIYTQRSPYSGFYGDGEQPIVIQRSPYRGYYGD